MTEEPGRERRRIILKAIAAMAANRVIGAGGRLPWHLPEDLRWFKRLTMGHPVIMGRATWESLDRPLPGRANIVLSRSLDSDALAGRATVVRSAAEAIDAAARKDDTAFVIGGAEVYRCLLPHCTELYLTCLRKEFEGDTRFPPFEHLFDACEVLAESPEFVLRRYEAREPHATTRPVAGD